MRKIIAPILIVLFVSCQKNDTPLKESGPGDEALAFYTEKLNEYAFVNEVFQDILNNSGDALLIAENSITGKTNTTKTDATITIEPFDLETFPKTITVDFGSGTLGVDGIVRSGIMIIESTGWYWQQGSKHTITFNDFFHGIFEVEGTQIVENFGENEEGNLRFAVSIEGGAIKTTDGVNILFEGATSREWISGSQTPLYIWDDEYLLNGSQWGNSTDGTPFQLIYEEPIHYVLLPRDIKSGIVNLEIGDVPDIKINYNNRTITILGVTSSF